MISLLLVMARGYIAFSRANPLYTKTGPQHIRNWRLRETNERP